jgi:hypothetical membrane protein
MRRGATIAYEGLALFIAVAIIVQVFLAGLGIFGAKSFKPHEDWGYTIHALSILVFILALIGPRTARTIGMGLALPVLLTIQISLVGTRDDTPGLAALHPVLALFALGLAFHIGQPLLSRRRGASAPRPAQ